MAEVNRVLCDRCFPDSASRFNQDIISAPGSPETGRALSFSLFFSSSPFVSLFSLHLSLSLKCERVI